jgi:hypothetical protein
MADAVLHDIVGQNPGSFDTEVEEYGQADILEEAFDRSRAYPNNYAPEITWFF